LKIRGISNVVNLLMGVNRFGHCLTSELSRRLPPTVDGRANHGRTSVIG